MNRATLGYILMFLCSAGVLWAILKVGSGLRAPVDLAGEWQVVDPAVPPAKARIDQSGVYFHIRLAAGPQVPYKLSHQGGDSILHGPDGQARRVQVDRAANGTTLQLLDPAGREKPVLLWRDAVAASAARGHGSHH